MSDESWAKEQKYKRVARVCVCTLTFLCVYPPLWFFLPYLATVLHAIFVLALVFIIFFGWVVSPFKRIMRDCVSITKEKRHDHA
jgi:CBS domain containing-hemolysin-like protein